MNNERLHIPTVQFDFENPPMDPVKLYNELSDFMCENRGVGLAANQIGYPWSVFVMGNPNQRDGVIAVFNPFLVDTFGEEVYIEEGCLSYPGLFLKIKRAAGVRVRFSGVTGETDTIKFDGFTARVFQHEYDHLLGLDFRKKATLYHYQKAMKDMKLLNRKRKRNDIISNSA